MMRGALQPAREGENVDGVTDSRIAPFEGGGKTEMIPMRFNSNHPGMAALPHGRQPGVKIS